MGKQPVPSALERKRSTFGKGEVNEFPKCYGEQRVPISALDAVAPLDHVESRRRNRQRTLFRNGSRHRERGCLRHDRRVSDRRLHGVPDHAEPRRALRGASRTRFLPSLREQVHLSRRGLFGGVALLAQLDGHARHGLHGRGLCHAVLVPAGAGMGVVRRLRHGHLPSERHRHEVLRGERIRALDREGRDDSDLHRARRLRLLRRDSVRRIGLSRPHAPHGGRRPSAQRLCALALHDGDGVLCLFGDRAHRRRRGRNGRARTRDSDRRSRLASAPRRLLRGDGPHRRDARRARRGDGLEEPLHHGL